MSGYLALADGTVWHGESVGADGHALGEAVFTTGMSGYQEAVTDPSFEDQLICFTAPMVGNYGVAEKRSESARTHARAVLMREARGPAWTDWLRERGVVALTGIDTRSLVLHLRDEGAMPAVAVANESLPVEEALSRADDSEPSEDPGKSEDRTGVVSHLESRTVRLEADSLVMMPVRLSPDLVSTT